MSYNMHIVLRLLLQLAHCPVGKGLLLTCSVTLDTQVGVCLQGSELQDCRVNTLCLADFVVRISHPTTC